MSLISSILSKSRIQNVFHPSCYSEVFTLLALMITFLKAREQWRNLTSCKADMLYQNLYESYCIIILNATV